MSSTTDIKLPGWYNEDHYHLEQDGDVSVIRSGKQEWCATIWRSDCHACTHSFMGESSFFPWHHIRVNCRSGSRPHCTCDSCF